MSGAGASALWKRKIKEKINEMVSQRADHTRTCTYEVCMCVYVCACVYAHMCICTRMCVYMCACTCHSVVPVSHALCRRMS